MPTISQFYGIDIVMYFNTVLRIKEAYPIGGYRLRLTLSDGAIVERDVGGLLVGPVSTQFVRIPKSSDTCG